MKLYRKIFFYRAPETDRALIENKHQYGSRSTLTVLTTVSKRQIKAKNDDYRYPKNQSKSFCSLRKKLKERLLPFNSTLTSMTVTNIYFFESSLLKMKEKRGFAASIFEDSFKGLHPRNLLSCRQVPAVHKFSYYLFPAE